MSQTKAQLISGTTAQDLTVDNIKLKDSVSSSKEIIIEGGNYFYTPTMYVPFGLENYKTTYSINLQFRNIKVDKELQDFLELVSFHQYYQQVIVRF